MEILKEHVTERWKNAPSGLGLTKRFVLFGRVVSRRTGGEVPRLPHPLLRSGSLSASLFYVSIGGIYSTSPTSTILDCTRAGHIYVGAYDQRATTTRSASVHRSYVIFESTPLKTAPPDSSHSLLPKNAFPRKLQNGVSGGVGGGGAIAAWMNGDERCQGWDAVLDKMQVATSGGDSEIPRKR